MDVLYHYCSNYVFQSIIENNSIWLSSLLQSNDSAEGKVVNNYVMYAFNREKLDPLFLSKLYEFLDAADTNAHGFGFCLSKEDDLLSQWRGYADDGQGVSIGFSKEYLEKLTAGEDKKYGLKLCEVEYYTTDDVKPINQYISEIYTHIHNGALSFIAKDFDGKPANQKSERKRRALFDLLKTLNEMSHFKFRIKSKAFSEEDEWRLLAEPQYVGMAPAIIEGLLSCKFRSTKNKLIPYIEIELKDYGVNPIQEVILGPKNDTPADLVNLLLRKSHHTGIKVRQSKASYR